MSIRYFCPLTSEVVSFIFVLRLVQLFFFYFSTTLGALIFYTRCILRALLNYTDSSFSLIGLCWIWFFISNCYALTFNYVFFLNLLVQRGFI